MNDIGDRIQLCIAVGGALAALWGLFWEGLPLTFFLPVFCALALMTIYSFIRWRYERWDPSGGKEGAKAFAGAVHLLHNVVRIGLWLVVVTCALVGYGIKFAPPWAADEAKRALLHESPTTHPELTITAAPPDLALHSSKDLNKASDVHFILVRGKEARFERATSILSAIANDTFTPISWFGVGINAMLVMIVLLLWFIETMGERTYEIPMRP